MQRVKINFIYICVIVENFEINIFEIIPYFLDQLQEFVHCKVYTTDLNYGPINFTFFLKLHSDGIDLLYDFYFILAIKEKVFQVDLPHANWILRKSPDILA